MKNTILIKFLFIVIASLQTGYAYPESTPPSFKFKRLTTINGLPNNDVQKLYQGRDGHIWIASRNGLYSYDGYTFKAFKSNLYNPDLLSNNNIFCLGEDYEQRLWIGTYKGLNMMDKKTGNIVQINRPEFVNNSISALLVTKDNKLFLGTDQGLYQYIFETDSCIFYNGQNTQGVLSGMSVKSLMEDADGHLWIGTWNSGLFRIDPGKGKYYSYPRMNAGNSAHVLFQDSHKRVWVGTWGAGLQLLENPYDLDKVSWRTYENEGSPNDINAFIYSISEDINSKKIWAGTPDGLSILIDEERGIFENYYPGDSEQTVSDNEVNSIIRDTQGMMWLGLLRGGINTVSTRKPNFESYTYDEIKQRLKTNSVIALLVDEDDILWTGIGSRGLVQYNRKTNKYKLNGQIDDFAAFDRLPSVLSITKLSSNGQIWIGTYNTGIFIYDKHAKDGQKVKQYSVGDDVPWLSGGRVYTVYEDSKKNIWVGTNAGLTVLNTAFEYLRLDMLECDGKPLYSSIISDIKEGEDKEMWAASNNTGIFRICGEGKALDNYSLKNYSATNGRLNSTNVSCIHKDKKNRIWIGSEGGGLNLYDRETDTFIPVHKKWNLPGDAVINITDDEQGNLWMGTNQGLMKLSVSEDLETVTYRLYTTSDGLLDNSFTRRALFKTASGEIFLGGYHGVNSFRPDQLIENETIFPPVVITDIKIHNCPWNDLEAKTRNKISTLTPEYTKSITLDYKSNNFTVEFAALGYETPSLHAYAYKLEGFDTQWQFTNSSRRFAYYNNLKPGTYRFILHTTNANGVWSNAERSMQVIILPPPWETWWAYLIYALVLAGAGLFVYRMLSNRMKLRNALQLREMEKAKSEELNHSKLQFFTNITHELLTPLTIISASVDELKTQAPEHTSQYRIMTSNVNRLIRLLQQILEFRKAETGNLKLKVSHGDLASFVTNSIESFRPLIKKKQLNLSIHCRPSPFPAYFDPDKMDKILYNLLSNASKYNNPGGNVYVNLYAGDHGLAVITVEDDGQGISEEAQKTLFKRFYEGDYRKFNTIGTGIGLSLTKDLVTLHGGKISVESKEGEGTLFKVIIPIVRSSFADEEIDDTVVTPEEPVTDNYEDVEEDDVSKEPAGDINILLIEDNEDLLQLMVKLLGAEYSIFTATNGEEGLNIIKEEDIDLVVSDIMMPVMDGIEFCKQVKNDFETCHIPVLLLTAKTGEADRVDAYESGADGYLNKPFNLSILHARINNLLKARERTNRDFKKQVVFEGKELNYTSIDEAFLQKAIECIHQHLDDPDYDQARFVDDMGTSRSTMFRKMKSLTGMSYVSFIRNVRLKAACRLLEEKKNIRVSELAYAVGFSDPRYFSTCFKKEFGMQPREYYEKFVATKE